MVLTLSMEFLMGLHFTQDCVKVKGAIQMVHSCRSIKTFVSERPSFPLSIKVVPLVFLFCTSIDLACTVMLHILFNYRHLQNC